MPPSPSSRAASDEACFVCATPLASALPHARDPVTGEVFSVLACPACGVGVTHPVPADLGRYYGAAYYGKRHGFTSWYRCWRRARLLARHAATPGRLLDVGCGDGDFLVSAARRGWRVAGTELRRPVPAAQALGIEVRGSVAEAHALGPFDAITLWHSFEHFPDPVSELDRIVAALAEGGTLVVIVPDFGGMQARAFGAAWFNLDVPRHVVHFTQDALLRLLESRGLEVERVDHHEIEYDVFGWLQSSLNVLLPTQNQFFSWLTRKPHGAPHWEIALAVLLAVVLAPLALVATLVGIVARRGVTLNVVARKPRREAATP